MLLNFPRHSPSACCSWEFVSSLSNGAIPMQQISMRSNFVTRS